MHYLNHEWTIESEKLFENNIQTRGYGSFSTIEEFWQYYNNTKLSEEFHTFANNADAILTNFGINILRKDYSSEAIHQISFEGVTRKHVLNILLFLIGEDHDYHNEIMGVRFVLPRETAHILVSSREAEKAAIEILATDFGIDITPICVSSDDDTDSNSDSENETIEVQPTWICGVMESTRESTWAHRKVAQVTTPENFWEAIDSIVNRSAGKQSTNVKQTFSLKKKLPEIYLFKPYGLIETHPHWDVVREASGSPDLVELTIKLSDVQLKKIMQALINRTIDCSPDIAGIRIKSNDRTGGDVRLWITCNASVGKIRIFIYNLLNQDKKVKFSNKNL